MTTTCPVPQGVTPLIGEAAIQHRVGELAQALVAEAGTQFTMVPVLRGSFVFAADLLRALARAGAFPEVAFLDLQSYGDGLESSGTVTVSGPVPAVAGRRVVLVEDILDTGRTLREARNLLMDRGAAAVHLAVLLDKPARREVDLVPDYRGFEVPDRFVVGYGLDARGHYRGLPCVAVLD